MLVSVTESDPRYIKAMQEFRGVYVVYVLFVLYVLFVMHILCVLFETFFIARLTYFVFVVVYAK